MALKTTQVNSEAAHLAFGLRMTSSSLKAVHVAQALFAESIGEVSESEAFFEFLTKPGKLPSGELPQELRNLVNASAGGAEDLDRVRTHLRLVADNDNGLYSSPDFSVPTCTGKSLVMNPVQASTAGQFLLHIISEYAPELQASIQDLLTDERDAISLLFRPLHPHLQSRSRSATPWRPPELAPMIGPGSVTHDIGQGFRHLQENLEREKDQLNTHNKLRWLRLIIKFSCFALILYSANRAQEILQEVDGAGKRGRVPMLFNYTGSDSGPVAEASSSTENLMVRQVELANRLGIRTLLDKKGYGSIDEKELLRDLRDGKLLDVSHRRSPDSRRDDLDVFETMYQAKVGEPFEKLVAAMGDAIHSGSDRRFKAYTPKQTIQTFAWRTGLTKPRGNRAMYRRFRPDPEVLEAIVLSALPPDEAIELPAFCDQLRSRYGIIVGGTHGDYRHLREWDIRIGASQTRESPLAVANYNGFTQALADLGYAYQYADEVTIVRTQGA